MDASVLQLPAEHEASLAAWTRATPLSALGPLLQEQVDLHLHGETTPRTFRMWRPAEPDRLLEHPSTLEAFSHDEYMPYWCDLWPVSRMLAKAILASDWQPGTEALEVGCGLGMAGVAALAKGLQVVFSDYDATALRFAAANALEHGYRQFELLPFDWSNPPKRQFSFIFAADLLYEMRSVAPVIALLQSMLAPQGVAWVTDQDRSPSTLWRKSLKDQGFVYDTETLHAGQPAAPGQTARRVKGTLYRIRRG
ncbi:MAG TPA: class I SAM-dependent methyltransferase [Gemmatales bacterium]|nr:class I SAM-dependent methyltransferase [Gemmatales bacterium]